MVLYAYKDISRKQLIHASEAITLDRASWFYCPNPNCEAQLYICAVEGSKQAYFRATKSKYKHTKNCHYFSNEDFNPNEFDENAFNFESAINNLYLVTTSQKKTKIPKEHSIGDSKKKSPRTIKQLYNMCKSMPVTEKYGESEIGDMLLDDRSMYKYPRGCFGNKIIESCISGRFYEPIGLQIFLKASLGEKKYTFILQFKDKNVFNEIRNQLFNNKDKIIIVAGEWKSANKYNHFITELISKRQIAVV